MWLINFRETNWVVDTNLLIISFASSEGETIVGLLFWTFVSRNCEKILKSDPLTLRRVSKLWQFERKKSCVKILKSKFFDIMSPFLNWTFVQIFDFLILVFGSYLIWMWYYSFKAYISKFFLKCLNWKVQNNTALLRLPVSLTVTD